MARETPSLSFLCPKIHYKMTNHHPPPASPLSPPHPTPPSSPTSTAISARIHIPPPPLHLRTLLYPPPPPLFHATVPKTPYPWIWKCHLCNSVYRLGVTRRCLEDGHYFCNIPSPPPGPVQDEKGVRERGEESSFGEGFESTVARLLAIERERKRKRSSRRSVERKKAAVRNLIILAGQHTTIGGEKSELYIMGEYGTVGSSRRIKEVRYWDESLIRERDGREKAEKDCWRDCDFPSECLNGKVSEREWREKRERMRVLEEEWVRGRARLQTLIETGEEIENDEESGWDGDVEMDVDTPPTDFYDAENYSVTSIEEDPRISAEERREDENLGPLGTDCDGLGEESKLAEYTQYRRKSLDAAAEGEIPTPSPLKGCSFGFLDLELKCNLWAREKRNKVEDVKMAESV